MKTLFEGRLGWIAFPFTIPRTISDRLSGGAKKSLVVQKALYITNGHIFRFCPKNFWGGGTPPARSLQKVLSLFNGQNESECHDFVSRTFSSLLSNGQNDAAYHGFVITRAKKEAPATTTSASFLHQLFEQILYIPLIVFSFLHQPTDTVCLIPLL